MKAPRIDLVYFAGCPHVEAARAALREALGDVPGVASWREWDRDDPRTPAAFRVHGSPTVLVDGRDVAPVVEDAGCCRVYAGREGFGGAPSPEAIRAALHAACTEGDRSDGA